MSAYLLITFCHMLNNKNMQELSIEEQQKNHELHDYSSIQWEFKVIVPTILVFFKELL